jgi:type II secretory pathway component GspD/PulD (secretin)
MACSSEWAARSRRWWVAIALLVVVAQSVYAQAQTHSTTPERGASQNSQSALQQATAVPPPAPPPSVPPEAVPSDPPVVRYQNGELTIETQNSTLDDILRAVSKLTGAIMYIPPEANERVAGQMGPGPVVDVLNRLLNRSNFNYAILGSAHSNGPVQVVLSVKSGDSAAPQQVRAPDPAEASLERASDDSYLQRWQRIQQSLIARLNARGKQAGEDSQPQDQPPPE